MVPPHDLEAERSVLGAMLLAPQVRAGLSELGLRAGHFYRPEHRAVFEAMLDMPEPDTVLLADALRGRLGAGIEGLVDEIAGSVPNVANWRGYARIVLDLWEMRGWHRASLVIAEAVPARDYGRLAQVQQWIAARPPREPDAA